MIDAKEFNRIAAERFKAELGPLGFRKSGTIFWRHEPPSLLAVVKQSFRGVFLGYCLGVTFDFLANTRDGRGKLKPPAYVEDYPTAVPLFRLRWEYERHDSPAAFSGGLNARSFDFDWTTEEDRPEAPRSVRASAARAMASTRQAESYIDESIEIVRTDGLRFQAAVDPATSLELLRRDFGGTPHMPERLRDELLAWLERPDS